MRYSDAADEEDMELETKVTGGGRFPPRLLLLSLCFHSAEEDDRDPERSGDGVGIGSMAYPLLATTATAA